MQHADGQGWCYLTGVITKQELLEDMGYPNWVAEKGYVPRSYQDWECFKKSADCAKNFVTPDSGGKGRMVRRSTNLAWRFNSSKN